MKRISKVLGVLAACACLFVTGCGNAAEPLPEVSKTISFTNETGKNVTQLRLRPNAEAVWEKNVLSDTLWEANYAMDVNLDGEVPESDEWQISMTFEDNAEVVWENVSLNDGQGLLFSLDEIGRPVVTIDTTAVEDGDSGTDAGDATDPGEDAVSE